MIYPQIKWVDEYIRNIGPYIYVREEDRLLIKIPNEAYKINSQGIRVIKHLLTGSSVYSIIDSYPDKERAAQDIHDFFCDIRALLKGCYNEKIKRRAIEQIPFKLPFNRLPVLSEIALTYRCNLQCRFCYAGCGCKKDNNAKELSTKKIKTILSMIKREAEVPSVSFTGGEPCLRKDLPELIRYAKSLKMWTNLITNGTLITDKMASAFKKAGLDSAQISMEAGNAALHDSIVHAPGAFEKTLIGITALKEAGIRIHTNTTISKLNKDHLTGIIDMTKKIGLDKLSMNLLMPEGSALNGLNDLLVPYSEIGEIVIKVNKYAEDNDVEFMWYSPVPMCIFNTVSHGLGNKGCAACDGLLSISPTGDILPCSSFPRPMYNMLEIKEKFKEAWSSKKMAYFQKKKFAHAFCQKCEDLAICNGGCPLYWKQVGYNEILPDHCKEVV
ncbi:MAG: radical SAM protein [Spirochaetes bacterium]|nr:radical SAM protein [Spirochaetota bacterium]